MVLPTGRAAWPPRPGELAAPPRGPWHAQDVTDRHRVQEELRRTALTDPLTGLGNRLLLVDRLTRSVAALGGPDGRTLGHVAVIAVDLDGLKRVNDTHGHATGDELLRETARRLRSVVRDRDLVARLGGDEFVLLCAGVDPAGATRLAERIVAEISTPYSLPGGVTAGPGRASASRDRRTWRRRGRMLAQADARSTRPRRRRERNGVDPVPARGSTEASGHDARPCSGDRPAAPGRPETARRTGFHWSCWRAINDAVVWFAALVDQWDLASRSSRSTGKSLGTPYPPTAARRRW